ncbi:MAG: hypothetical protein HYR75_07810 [Gemmatimonadetes bacterium]|nr:hypothetical protein [Gemmatimonadota bacterium]MBI3504442.1 hypothetical protein [Pseudomonadota bacterium]
MIGRATAVWFAILACAFANGALRELAIAPRVGIEVAHVVSTMLLAAVVLLVTWLSIPWMGPGSVPRAAAVGAWWVALTLAFEFGAGHWLMHKPWSELLHDYDLRAGRVWLAVPIVTWLAPVWAYRDRRPQ